MDRDSALPRTCTPGTRPLLYRHRSHHRDPDPQPVLRPGRHQSAGQGAGRLLHGPACESEEVGDHLEADQLAGEAPRLADFEGLFAQKVPTVELDGPAEAGFLEAANVRYIGPILDDPAWVGSAPPLELEEDGRPLVVVGFSTTFQNQQAILQRVISALGTLDVRGLVTLGPAMAGVRFDLPPNVTTATWITYEPEAPEVEPVARFLSELIGNTWQTRPRVVAIGGGTMVYGAQGRLWAEDTSTRAPLWNRAGDAWLMVTLPDGRKGIRETNTMPQWAGSCWYYLRYLDPRNAHRV